MSSSKTSSQNKDPKDQKDLISPDHYSNNKIEPIDISVLWSLSYQSASAVEYIARAGKKDYAGSTELSKLADLRKARFFLSHEIYNLERSLDHQPELTEAKINMCPNCGWGETDTGQDTKKQCPKCEAATRQYVAQIPIYNRKDTTDF